jgi:Bacteriophage Mu Gam like protein
VATITPAGAADAAQAQLAEYAKLKAKRDKIMGKAKDDCAEIETKMQQLETGLQAYAESEAGQAAFGGQKSLKLPQGTLQWKTTRDIAKDKTKFDALRFVEIVEKLAPAALSVKVDTPKLLQAWDHVGKLPVALAEVGVDVVSKNTFHVLPK